MLPPRWLVPLLVLAAASTRLGADEAQLEAGELDLSPVRHVDLPRYMGRWYVIFHVPNFLENGKVATSDNYTLLPDGTLRDVFKYRKHSFTEPEKQWSGRGWITDAVSNASWRMRLFWPFKAGYRILELDPNYLWAVASTDSGSLFWVLSRNPTLDEVNVRTIRARLAMRGLDPSKLEAVPQPYESR
jgi:apolipoprotein D and lipocalin family protein